MTFRVIELLKRLSHAILRTVVKKLTRFQLTQSIARSLYDTEPLTRFVDMRFVVSHRISNIFHVLVAGRALPR